jgi:hypothetical protein
VKYVNYALGIDFVPIKPIDRQKDNFGHLQAEDPGSMGCGIYK